MYNMYVQHVRTTCTYNMYVQHVRTTCTYNMYVQHVRTTCTYNMYAHMYADMYADMHADMHADMYADMHADMYADMYADMHGLLALRTQPIGSGTASSRLAANSFVLAISFRINNPKRPSIQDCDRFLDQKHDPTNHR